MKRHDFASAGVLKMLAAFVGVLGAFAAGDARAEVIPYSRGAITVQSLANRPDTDVVEFPGGRRMKVADIRRLNVLAQQMRAAVPGSKMASVPKLKPDAANIKMRIATRVDLAAALVRPDADTVQLPSGQLVTVGQIKFLQPYVEKKLGHSLADAGHAPNVAGPVLHVTRTTTKEEFIAIFRDKPDDAVLQAPNGKRITVRDLKEGMRLLMTRGGTLSPVGGTRAKPGAAPVTAPQVKPTPTPKRRAQ